MSGFGSSLTEGAAFGAAMGMAERLSAHAQQLQQLQIRYDDLVERWNALVDEKNTLHTERDECQCALNAYRELTERLGKMLREAHGWNEASAKAEAHRAEIERAATRMYREDMRKLGYKFDDD